MVRVMLAAGLVVVVGLAGVVATVLLSPFWSWFEAATGIESLGHFGPAAWCYAAVCLPLLAGGGLAVYALTGRRDARNP